MTTETVEVSERQVAIDIIDRLENLKLKIPIIRPNGPTAEVLLDKGARSLIADEIVDEMRRRGDEWFVDVEDDDGPNEDRYIDLDREEGDDLRPGKLLDVIHALLLVVRRYVDSDPLQVGEFIYDELFEAADEAGKILTRARTSLAKHDDLYDHDRINELAEAFSLPPSLLQSVEVIAPDSTGEPAPAPTPDPTPTTTTPDPIREEAPQPTSRPRPTGRPRPAARTVAPPPPAPEPEPEPEEDDDEVEAVFTF